MTRDQIKRLAELRRQERNYARTARKYPTPSNLRQWADAIERRDACEREAQDPTWYVVYSQGSIILGVYGSALLAEARSFARRVARDTGFCAYIGCSPRTSA